MNRFRFVFDAIVDTAKAAASEMTCAVIEHKKGDRGILVDTH